MIIDKIENARFYSGLGEGIEKGLNWLEKTDLKDLEDGKYVIEGNIYANLQTYETKPVEQCAFEAHRKYIDIQYIVKGCEKMGFGNICDFSEKTPYETEKDIIFLNGGKNFLSACDGTFVIFTPEDAHMPCVCDKQPQTVKKVVVKVPVN